MKYFFVGFVTKFKFGEILSGKFEIFLERFEIFSDLLIVVRGVRGAGAVVPVPVQPGQILQEALDVVPGDSAVSLVLVFLLPATQQQETPPVVNQTGRSAAIRVKLSRGDQN